MNEALDYPKNDFIANYLLILEENNLPDWQRKKLKKKIEKKDKKGNLVFPKMGANWLWRLCAADLMRGNFNRWYGFEYRSKWAYIMSDPHDFCYRKWDGEPCRLLLMAEQGIGDEILFASTFHELLTHNPDTTIECDSRLLPVFNRAFKGSCISRWINDEINHSKSPQHYFPDHPYSPGEFDCYLPAADCLRSFRTKRNPPGTPYLTADPKRVEDYKEKLKDYPKPWIGVSWLGGRSFLEPEKLRKGDGTYIDFQYGEHDTPEWMIKVDCDHNDMEDVFALCKALDKVYTVQNYTVHVAGSLGKECHAVKPYKQYGEVGFDDSTNNRLKWAYGTGVRKWTMPWYNSVTVYNSWQEFQ